MGFLQPSITVLRHYLPSPSAAAAASNCSGDYCSPVGNSTSTSLSHGGLQRRCSLIPALPRPRTEVLWGGWDHINWKGMGKAKGGSIFIRLVSAAGTGFFYVKRKNPRRLQEKLEFRKYDPRVNKHVLFTKAKMK
ncbi:hypothetical protein Taro_009400 [Colocasia esculenta]|uniref:Large ribosomal subunit protein bL33c n=1 Tax=Colocasia esculenta TaxID=4460 RepID=A0A843U5L0_COLES|nr:hypothetical protein [Colocasia esculenta]